MNYVTILLKFVSELKIKNNGLQNPSIKEHFMLKKCNFKVLILYYSLLSMFVLQ